MAFTEIVCIIEKMVCSVLRHENGNRKGVVVPEGIAEGKSTHIHQHTVFLRLFISSLDVFNSCDSTFDVLTMQSRLRAHVSILVVPRLASLARAAGGAVRRIDGRSKSSSSTVEAQRFDTRETSQRGVGLRQS